MLKDQLFYGLIWGNNDKEEHLCAQERHHLKQNLLVMICGLFYKAPTDIET